MDAAPHDSTVEDGNEDEVPSSRGGDEEGSQPPPSPAQSTSTPTPSTSTFKPDTGAAGLVGALDHVLKKTFRDLYEDDVAGDGQTADDVAAEGVDDAAKDDQEENSHRDPDAVQDDTEEVDEPSESGDAGQHGGEQQAGHVDEDSEPCDGADAGELEDDETPSPGGSEASPLPQTQGSTKDALGFEVESVPVEAVQAEIELIEDNLQDELDRASSLEDFLEEERRRSAAADEAVAAEVYKQGLLVGPEYPLGPSSYAVHAGELKRFGTLSAHLINVNSLLEANVESELYRRGQVKRGEAKACEMRPNTPNYLMPKERSKRKALMAAKAENKARSEEAAETNSGGLGNQEEEERRSLEDKHQQRQEESDRRQRDASRKPRQMSAEAMQANLDLLARMKKQIAFLKNPRFTLTTRATRDWRQSLLNKDLSEPPTFAAQQIGDLEQSWDTGFLEESAPFGHPEVDIEALTPSPVRDRDGSTDGLVVVSGKEVIPSTREKKNESVAFCSFQVNPGFAYFTDYEVNEPMECVLKVANVAPVSRGLRFLPPTSKYFSIVSTEFPSTTSIVAPGMACHLRVAFCADSLADYRDFVTVCTETERFRIALVARRTPPKLSLPRLLNAGSCFVGTKLTHRFSFRNFGGPARFHLVSEEEWARGGADSGADDRLSLADGALSLSPRRLALESNQEACIEVEFAPQTVGLAEENFLIVCDNCQIQLVTLRAASCQVKVELSRIGDLVLDLSKKALVVPPSAVDLGAVVRGGAQRRTVAYLNPTPIALEYHWSIRDPRAKASPAFTIEPQAGVLEPSREQTFTITFAPDNQKASAGAYDAFAQLVVDRIPPGAVEGVSVKRSSTKKGHSDDGLRSVPCSRLVLSGEARLPTVAFEPSAQVQVAHPLAAGIEHAITTTVRNGGPTAVSLSWENLEASDEGRTTFCPEPAQVDLRPGATTSVSFRFVPQNAGPLRHRLHCVLNGQPSSCDLRVHAEVTGPLVALDAREVDFGLLGVGKASAANFVVRNLSSRATAEISLEEIGHENDQAAAVHIANGSAFMLGPGREHLVELTCAASQSPERMRKCLAVHVKHSRSLFVNLRAEIQSPKVYLRASETHSKCKIDLGTTYVTVPVTRTIRLVNLSNLSAPFRWIEPAAALQEEEAAARAYNVQFSSAAGVLQPKESREIVVTFEGIKPGRVATVFVCEVEGMPAPLGFTLHSLVRGLVIAYSLVGPDVTAALMAPERPQSSDTTTTMRQDAVPQSGNHGASSSPSMSGATGSASSSNMPVLDFGSDIELCKRKRLRVCIANHSAITTRFDMVIKAFGARTVPRSLKAAPRSAGTREPPTVAKLGSAHEEWEIFASEDGRKHTREKVQALEDRDVLSAGRGVAFLAQPSTGVLRPWQAVIVDIYCFNNMPGRYRSEVHCVVDGLNPSVAPIKASVVGSPLCLAMSTVGLVKRDEENRLHFGHPLVGTEPVHKVIKVANNGPVGANVSWRVVAERGANADLVETSIVFDAEGMALDADKRVQVEVRPHTDLSKAPPFLVEPEELEIRPYASGSFRVTFIPNADEEADDAAVLIADADWVDDGNSGPVNEDGTIASQITLESLATELLTASDVPSTSDVEAERGDSRQSRMSRSAIAAPAGATLRAPLRDFERVRLAAHSASPCLALDRTLRGTPERAFLGFVVWSTRSMDHSSFFKTLTFKNSSATNTGVVLRAEPPFVLHQVRVTSATSAATSGHELAQLRKAVRAEMLTEGQEAALPPGATLALTVRFQPSRLVDKRAHDPNDVLRTTHQGRLDMYFHNGDHQAVDLEATTVAPAVLLAPALFDFGHVHVETSARTTLYMANPSIVPAQWKIIHVPAKKDAAGEVKIDDPSCWCFDLEKGLLAGPTLPLSSAKACMPQGFDANGKRVPLTISLCFSPSLRGYHESKFRFVVQGGLDFDVVVRGRGSYEEQHDASVRPLPAPEPRRRD